MSGSLDDDDDDGSGGPKPDDVMPAERRPLCPTLVEIDATPAPAHDPETMAAPSGSAAGDATWCGYLFGPAKHVSEGVADRGPAIGRTSINFTRP